MRKLLLFITLTFPCVLFADPLTTVYVAKKIITMDPTQPIATAVAVKEGRIYSVGSLAEMQKWMKEGSYQVNRDFADETILPGFIEAHCHFSQIAMFFPQLYLGYYDYPGFEGKIMPGSKTKEVALQKLQDANKNSKDSTQPLVAWGYDPIYLNNQEFTAQELDKISSTRPIFVLNASGHIAYVNTYLLNKVGYKNSSGVLKELIEMMPAVSFITSQAISPEVMTKSFQLTADMARRAGLTTLTDLFYIWPIDDKLTTLYKKSTDASDFPLRIVIAYSGDYLNKTQGAQAVQYLQKAMTLNSNKLKFGPVKFFSDGSIQGFTARLNWPGYFNGAPNGIFNTDTEKLKQDTLAFWKAGAPIHIHTNGNQAVDSVLDVLTYLQQVAPQKDPAFVVEHNQMSNPDQFARLAALGGSTNLFTNQIYYWGDQHKALTMGPDLAEKMDDPAQAKRAGLIYSMHTDSPITPLLPLHTVWSAVNRLTASGKVLGPSERISVEDALQAITLNAARILQLDDEIGSIVVGKRADFTILKQDPLSVAPEKLKDIAVSATIQDGRVYR